VSDLQAKERAARIMREMPGTYAIVCWERGGHDNDAFIRVEQNGKQIAIVNEDGEYEAEG